MKATHPSKRDGESSGKWLHSESCAQNHSYPCVPPNAEKIGTKTEAWESPTQWSSALPRRWGLMTVAASLHGLLPLQFLGYSLCVSCPYSVTSEMCFQKSIWGEGESILALDRVTQISDCMNSQHNFNSLIFLSSLRQNIQSTSVGEEPSDICQPVKCVAGSLSNKAQHKHLFQLFFFLQPTNPSPPSSFLVICISPLTVGCDKI